MKTITQLALLVALFTSPAIGQELSSIAPPVLEESYLPSYYFNLDFAFVQPRMKNATVDGDVAFTSKLDWTLAPRFEFGLMNRGAWNPYFGYRGVYSDAYESFYEPSIDSFFSLYRSAELHAIDFGVLSDSFCLLSVIKAQWDFSARLTVADFQDRFSSEFVVTDPSYIVARVRQQFVGAGPRAGMRMELPWRDSGLSLAAQMDVGIQWGSYRGRVGIESMIDGESGYEEESASKGGVLWHAGGQLALRYAPPRYCDRLSFQAGYMYEGWFSKDLGLFEGANFGRFDYHGPFFLVEWRY